MGARRSSNEDGRLRGEKLFHLIRTCVFESELSIPNGSTHLKLSGATFSPQEYEATPLCSPISPTSRRAPCVLSRRKWRNPFSQINCASMERGLRPRPMPKHSKIGSEGMQETVRENAHIKEKLSPRLCGQIEKLVLCSRYREALEMFEIFELQSGFDVGCSTYDALVSACIGLKSIRDVKRVFSYMISNGFEPDLYMRNRVLLMHVKCGLMADANKLFGEMQERDFLSWNIMITGQVESGNYFEAFQLFLTMWEEFSYGDSRTFSIMVRASAGLGLIYVGRQIHSCALKMGVADHIYVSCALIDMYSKCGSIEDAQFVFDQMPEKTTVGWNSIIAAYALHGYTEEALCMYYEMRDNGVKMDHFTFSIVVRICTKLASLDHARQAHAALIRHDFGSDVVANTALVDFYSKWGRMKDARNVFENMPCKNIASWNALIAGNMNMIQGILELSSTFYNPTTIAASWIAKEVNISQVAIPVRKVLGLYSLVAIFSLPGKQ
ncbi:hypothetical protein L6164_007491 [Bauhinia variegata]|uniref:Uncharacterized protein n=1 Tax=Bauhinia variegata TaxID=167791 RepID=A0ACB9PJ73_BAUVA|nr:hypothetical protein L6164_007491 [Bauhinia variegata]